MEQAFWTGVVCIFGAGFLMGFLAHKALAHYQYTRYRRLLANRKGTCTVEEVTAMINYTMRDEIE